MLGKIAILIATLVSGFANLFLAIYVYVKDPKKRINKNFAFFGASLFLWCLANFFLFLNVTIIFDEITSAVSAILMVSIIFFCCALAEVKLSKLMKIIIFVIASLVVFFSFTRSIVESVSPIEDYGLNAKQGPMFNFWLACVATTVVIGGYLLINALRKLDKQKKEQIYYFISGIGTTLLWGIVIGIVLPLAGFFKLEMIHPAGTFFVTAFTSYAIVKYNALGIKSLLFKIFINTLILIAVIVLLVGIIFAETWVRDNFGLSGFFIMLIFVSVIIFFIGRLFFNKTKALENAKISLTQMLAKSEEEKNKMTTIVTNFSDGLLIFDKNNKIVIVNPQAEKIFNINKDQLIGKTVNELKNWTETKQALSNLPDNLKQFFKERIQASENLYLEISIIPLSSAEELLGGLIILHDITDEKRIENMKSEFVSLAAHQLRTPLSGIRWALEAMVNDTFGKINKAQKKLMVETYDRNAGLINIVNDLLNVAKIEEGKYLFQKEMGDIEELFEYELDLHKNDLAKKKINFKYEKLAEKLPQIMLDKDKIKVVFQNLIENAIEYTPEDGEIDAVFSTEDDNIKFQISDSGIKIPEEEKKRLFEKFFRATNAVKVNPGGSGLGLFISKNIIEAHRGKISFDTSNEKGATFYFTLPVKEL